MTSIDYAQRIINFKVVYFGPAGSGKTANLAFVWDKTRGPAVTCGKLETLGQSEAAYYEHLPIALSTFVGYKIQLHLYTVPSGPGCAGARRQLLEGVDGVAFVADSRGERSAENAALFQELVQALQTWGVSLWQLPFVLQCNMSDAPTAVPCAVIASALLGTAAERIPTFASSATSGAGVFETLKTVTKLVLQELREVP